MICQTAIPISALKGSTSDCEFWGHCTNDFTSKFWWKFHPNFNRMTLQNWITRQLYHICAVMVSVKMCNDLTESNSFTTIQQNNFYWLGIVNEYYHEMGPCLWSCHWEILNECLFRTQQTCILWALFLEMFHSKIRFNSTGFPMNHNFLSFSITNHICNRTKCNLCSLPCLVICGNIQVLL